MSKKIVIVINRKVERSKQYVSATAAAEAKLKVKLNEIEL